MGSACARRLAAAGAEVITADRARVDLRRQDQVEAFMAQAKPDAVVVAAARVGGILANDTLPAEFRFACARPVGYRAFRIRVTARTL